MTGVVQPILWPTIGAPAGRRQETVENLLHGVSLGLVSRPAVPRQGVDGRPRQALIADEPGGTAVTVGGGVHGVSSLGLGWRSHHVRNRRRGRTGSAAPPARAGGRAPRDCRRRLSRDRSYGRARSLAVEMKVRARDAGDRRGVRQRADQVEHGAHASRRRSRPAEGPPRPGGGSRTGSSPPPRSSSARSCGRAAPSRWREADRRPGTARWRARPRSRAPRARRPACSSARAWRAGGTPAPARGAVAGSLRGGGSRPAGSRRSSPSRPRTARIESSRSKRHEALEDERRARRARPTPRSTSAGVAMTGLSLAVVAEAPGLQHGRAAQVRDRTRRARRRLPTGRDGGTGSPTARESASRRRGPAQTSSARGGGKTRHPLRERSAELTGTFSNS